MTWSLHDYTWIVFVVWGAVSFFWSYNSSMIWYPLAGWLGYFLFMIAIQTLTQSQRSFHVIIMGVFVIVFFMHVYAILTNLSFGSSWNSLFSKNMNYTPAYLLMLSPFVIYNDNIIAKYVKAKTLYHVLAALLGAALIYVFIHNGNRGSMVAGTAMLSYVLIDKYIDIRKATILWIYVSAIVLFALVYSSFPQAIMDAPFVDYFTRADEVRQGYTERTISLLSNRWLTGFGLGNWAIELFSQDVSSFSIGNYASSTDYSRNHNFFNQMLGELGVVGLGSYLTFLIVPLCRAIKSHSTLTQFQKASFCSIIVYLFISLFYASVNFDNFFFSEINLLLVITVDSLVRDTKMPVITSWLKTPLVLMGSMLVVWFFITRLQFEKYQRTKAVINPIEKVDLLQNIYMPQVYTHHRNHSIAFDISKEYYAMDSLDQALYWVNVALSDDKSSRESMLLSAKIHLRHLRDMQKTEELLENYSDIYGGNFDVNLLSLELALRNKEYYSVRANRDAVVHSGYALRKSILELCLYNSNYLYLSLIHISEPTRPY